MLCPYFSIYYFLFQNRYTVLFLSGKDFIFQIYNTCFCLFYLVFSNAKKINIFCICYVWKKYF